MELPEYQSEHICRTGRALSIILLLFHILMKIILYSTSTDIPQVITLRLFKESIISPTGKSVWLSERIPRTLFYFIYLFIFFSEGWAWRRNGLGEVKHSLEKRKEKEANPPISCPGAFHIVLVPLRPLKTLLYSPVRLQLIFSQR